MLTPPSRRMAGKMMTVVLSNVARYRVRARLRISRNVLILSCLIIAYSSELEFYVNPKKG
jgi:hypothetical protein